MSKNNVKPFPPAEARRQAETTAAPPQRPALELVPFQQKDPNLIIARLERERTALEDRLNDAQTVIQALDTYVRELETYCGIEPAQAEPEPAPTAPTADPP